MGLDMHIRRILGCLSILFVPLACGSSEPSTIGDIYLTGDIHGSSGVDRIWDYTQIEEGDLLIILGDFELVWEGAQNRAGLRRMVKLPDDMTFEQLIRRWRSRREKR